MDNKAMGRRTLLRRAGVATAGMMVISGSVVASPGATAAATETDISRRYSLGKVQEVHGTAVVVKITSEGNQSTLRPNEVVRAEYCAQVPAEIGMTVAIWSEKDVGASPSAEPVLRTLDGIVAKADQSELRVADSLRLEIRDFSKFCSTRPPHPTSYADLDHGKLEGSRVRVAYVGGENGIPMMLVRIAIL